MQTIKSNPTKTVLTIVIGLIILFLFFEYNWVLIAAVFLGLISLISTKAATFIDFLWMRLALVLSHIFPPILLSIIYYFFLFPVALLSRLFRKADELQLKNKASHNWIKTNRKREKVSFEKMW